MSFSFRISFAFILLSLLYANSYSQKKLTLYKSFGGIVYELDTLTLSTKQVMMVLKENPEAFVEFKVARTKSTISSVLGFVGGLLVVAPLITAVAGGQPEWGFSAGGAALFIASIPFNASFRGHALNALDIYNSGVKTSTIKSRTSIQMYGSGASIVVRF